MNGGHSVTKLWLLRLDVELDSRDLWDDREYQKSVVIDTPPIHWQIFIDQIYLNYRERHDFDVKTESSVGFVHVPLKMFYSLVSLLFGFLFIFFPPTFFFYMLLMPSVDCQRALIDDQFTPAFCRV